MRSSVIWIIVILSFSFSAQAQNATFNELPQDNQLFQRNVATNTATVPVQGFIADAGYSQIRLELKNEQGIVDQIVRNLSYSNGQANFQFSVNIPAERNNHEIAISALRNGNWIFVKSVPRLLAGDIYIINGQSNAQAAAAPHADDVDEYTRSWFALYGWGTLNLSFPGLWGARLAKQISDTQNLPIAIFNQAVGAEPINTYLPTVTNGNYASLMQRFENANMENPKIRAAFWFHGEANSYGTSAEEYLTDFTAIKQAWERDYQIDYTFVYQMRFGSCTSKTADILESHRRIGATLPNTVSLSTTNANHDNCHFYYENGYRELGDRMSELVKNKLYGGNNNLAYSPNIVNANISSTNNRKLILEFDRNLPLKTIGGFPHQDFRLEYSNASIVGGRVNGSIIELDLNQPIQFVSGLTYLSHIGYTPGWITNQADVGIFTFNNFTISNAPTNSQSCNAIYSVNNQQLIVSNADAPIVTIGVLKGNDYSQIYSCSTWETGCTSPTAITLAPGEYFIRIKTYNDNGNTIICDIFEPFTIAGPTPNYDCPNLSANIGDSCNDGNANTTNDVVQNNCSCAGTIPPPTYDCPALGSNIGDSCNDGNANTTNDVVQNNCSCAGTIPPPTYDCPALGSNIGDSCNDGNPNTINDVVQNNCSCAGTIPPPTYDCPALGSNIGDSCNDGNPNTTNDVVQNNCSCAGTIPPPTYDCPALGRNIGDSCNDGNANTTDDVIQDDCSCAGTPLPPSGCNATYSVNGNTVTFQNIDAPISFVKIMDTSFQPKFECNSWSTGCASTFSHTLTQPGLYYVQIQTSLDWTSPNICNIFEAITISDGGNQNTCQNVTNGGDIIGNEVLCPGDDSNPFLSSNFPSGGTGSIEYRWLKSYSGCPNNSSQVIQGANNAIYEPGVISETTYFRRQSKRAGCSDWFQGESNCVVKYIATDCVPQTDPCDVTYSTNNNRLTISNLDFPINSVKIYDGLTYTEVFSCDNWSDACSKTTRITLPTGSYFVNIQTYTDWNNPVCTLSEMITIGNPQRQSNGNNQASGLSPNVSSPIQTELNVFPNPVQNELNVSLSDFLEKDITIRLVNHMGKQQKEITIQNNQEGTIKIPLDNLMNGIYLLWVHPEGARPISKKVLVRKDY